MAHSGPNGCSPYGNSPLLLNLPIISCKRLTGEELHSECQKTGFYLQEEEAVENKGEVFLFCKDEGLISLRKEKI